MPNHSPLKPHLDSRRAITDRLDTWPIDASELPTIDHTKLSRFEDPIGTFTEMLSVVGGESHLVDDVAQVADQLADIPAFAQAKRVASVVPQAVSGNVDGEAMDDAHTLASLDWMIARGEFAVAENGAIWVDGSSLPHRVMLFIAQYLAIVVSRRDIVDNMHQAYQRIGKPQPGFGVFVSGPSKTADIEQSLVLGAHGCRKLQVFLTP
ncbi:MAG: LUD domain-containing protein [Pirellulales bacterium]|nr:LUD domain-containing protein [Pirellulales bacterium]